MALEVQVTGEVQMKRVATSLRSAASPGPVRRRMRAGIATAVKPLQNDVRQAYRAIPAAGPASTGLRRELATATKLVIRASGKTAVVRLWVNPAAMPVGKQALPALVEGLRRWRHPVYGHTTSWVTQSAHPTFFKTVNPRRASVQAAAKVVVDEIAAEIGRGI